jgi:hypothetical protein
VKPYPAFITVNVADTLQFLSNGFSKSSTYRVVAPPEDFRSFRSIVLCTAWRSCEAQGCEETGLEQGRIAGG